MSPFLGMDQEYSIHASAPGAHLTVHIESRRAGERVFDATLSLERRPARDLRRLRLRHPAQPLRVLALIYGHAALLALRGARYHPHPGAAESVVALGRPNLGVPKRPCARRSRPDDTPALPAVWPARSPSASRRLRRRRLLERQLGDGPRPREAPT